MPNPTTGAPVSPAPDVEGMLKENLEGLKAEIEEMIQKGLSPDEAEALLVWAKDLEGKVKMVAAVLRNPTPETVSKCLRYIASGIDATRNRKWASSSLTLLKAVIARVS